MSNGSPTYSAAKTAKTPARSGRVVLDEMLHHELPVLVTSAMAGGLCTARSRSFPHRVAREASRFVALLRTAIRPRGPGALTKALDEEVRTGSLAAASADDVKRILDVWRRTLSPFAAVFSRATTRELLFRTLDRLERRALRAVATWDKDRIDVIAIGASAGGIPALQTLLGDLSEHLPATVLIVQHVSPSAPSLMPRVLAKNTRLSVVHAVEGAELHLGLAHVAPPGRHLTIKDGRIHLNDAPPVRHARPAADVLFNSASKAFGRHLASIVLSGADSDGADGSVAVRDHGGVTIVQQPNSARIPSMPESAIATGAVEYVVSILNMGAVINQLVQHGRSALSRAAR